MRAAWDTPRWGPLLTLAPLPARGVIAGTAVPLSTTCAAYAWWPQPAGPTNGGPFCLGDSCWNIIVQEGRGMSPSLLCASSIHFLALGKKQIKNPSVRVWMCVHGMPCF